MLATIIVNNYNYGRFLDAAIGSALAQTYPRCEVIVVDDGSTDNSREIIASYGSRVQPVLKTNAGQASAFNEGFRVSRGDVVIFLDADDLLLPSAVESAVGRFDGPGVSKVQWRMYEIDEAGARTGNLVPGCQLPEGDLRGKVVSHGPLSHGNAPTSGNAWPRWFLEDVLPVRDSGDKHGADAYLLTLASAAGSIRTVPRPQSCYRRHDGNFSGHDIQSELRRDVRRFDHHCRILADYLAEKGIITDPAVWKRPGTPYAWMEEMMTLPAQMAAVIPTGSSFILVDEDQLGSQCVEERQGIPFLERNGRYWGPPADGSTAVREMERLRSGGATHMVFIRPTMWWLDYYVALREHLTSNFPCVRKTDGLLVFDLRRTSAT